MIAKIFEFLLLDRILPILTSNNLPQLTLTAYQKGVSCSDAIFSCLEIISKLTRKHDTVFSCFYDLAPAFDTVEYPVLTSSPFTTHRGVHQGSVLSPVLFLLVMDPVLLSLKSKSCGISICGLYLSALSHADDICTISTSIEDWKAQVTHVNEFASLRGLIHNAEKCESLVSSCIPSTVSPIHTQDICIPVVNSARCLDSWWTSNLSCSKGIDANIKKARSLLCQGQWCLSWHPKSNYPLEALWKAVCPHSPMVLNHGYWMSPCCKSLNLFKQKLQADTLTYKTHFQQCCSHGSTVALYLSPCPDHQTMFPLETHQEWWHPKLVYLPWACCIWGGIIASCTSVSHPGVIFWKKSHIYSSSHTRWGIGLPAKERNY